MGDLAQKRVAAKQCTVSLLNSLTPALRAHILTRLRRFKLKSGQMLMRTGDPSDQIFFILHGIVEISRSDKFGRRIVLGRRTSGEVVGEVGILAACPRTADVETITECEIGGLYSDELQELLNEQPLLAIALLQLLAGRLASASDQSLELATQDVPTRIVNALVSLATLKNVEGNPVWIIDEKPTHARLAKIIGTSREVVCRSLKLLEKSGEVLVRGGRVLIKFPARRSG